MNSIIPWHKGVSILENSVRLGLYAINKPVNILSHPNNPSISTKAVVLASYNVKNESYAIISEQNHSNNSPQSNLFLLHRLDKATSGVLLLSDNGKVASYIKSLFKSRKVEKRYIALVYSPVEIRQKKQTWTDEYEFRKGAGNQTARTEMTVLNYCHRRKLAQLLLEPKTGYTNQLRIQCALRCLPIVGDDMHGNFALNKFLFHPSQQSNSQKGHSSSESKMLGVPLKNRLYLHAERISFSYDFQGIQDKVRFHSPIPEEFSIFK